MTSFLVSEGEVVCCEMGVRVGDHILHGLGEGVEAGRRQPGGSQGVPVGTV